jgi:hypothetical protein
MDARGQASNQIAYRFRPKLLWYAGAPLPSFPPILVGDVRVLKWAAQELVCKVVGHASSSQAVGPQTKIADGAPRWVIESRPSEVQDQRLERPDIAAQLGVGRLYTVLRTCHCGDRDVFGIGMCITSVSLTLDDSRLEALGGGVGSALHTVVVIGMANAIPCGSATSDLALYRMPAAYCGGS